MIKKHNVMKRLPYVLIIMYFGLLNYCSSQNSSATKYEYLVYLPNDYQQEGLKSYPVIFFLHGASLRGNNLEKINKYGIPKLIKEGKEFDFIIISPQCPSNLTWASEEWFLDTFADVKNNFRLDSSRVYLTGLSLGGEGTWYLSEKYPDLFAAIAPVCGRASAIKSIHKNIDKIANLPVWIFHGASDEVYPVKESDDIYKKLIKINRNVVYTRYPGLGHGATHDSAYRNDGFYNWFLSHTKPEIK